MRYVEIQLDTADNAVTAFDDKRADAVRKLIHSRFDCSLGTGLGKVKGRMFRIGHLGDGNDLTLIATLAACEMGLKLSGVKLSGSGVQAAMDYFADHPAPV